MGSQSPQQSSSGLPGNAPGVGIQREVSASHLVMPPSTIIIIINLPVPHPTALLEQPGWGAPRVGQGQEVKLVLLLSQHP